MAVSIMSAKGHVVKAQRLNPFDRVLIEMDRPASEENLSKPV